MQEISKNKAHSNNEKNKFQTLFENLPLGIIYQDNKGKVTDANTAALNILNYTSTEIRGKTPYGSNRQFVYEDFSQHPVAHFPCTKVLETGKPVLNKIVGFLNEKKTNIHWIKIDCIPLFNGNNNKPHQIYTTYTDITATKNNEILLKENEQKYISAQQIDKSGNFEYNFETKKLWASMEVFRIFGIKPNKTNITTNLLENCIVNKELLLSAINTLLEKGKKSNAQFTIQPYNRSNQKIISVKAKLIYDENDTLLKAVGVIKDITRKKRIEEKQKERNDFAYTMTNNHPAGIVACNEEGKLVLFNKTATKWHGIDVLKIPAEKWAENYGLHDPISDRVLQVNEIPLVKAFNEGKVVNQEMIIKAKGQKPRYVMCNGAAFLDKKGNKLGALAIMNDITQQKKREHELLLREKELKNKIFNIEQSEFFLKESAKIAKIGGWGIDLITQKVTWSDQVFKIHGLPVGKLPTLNEALDFFIEGSKETLTNAIEESIAKNKKYDLELRFQNAKKEKLWVNTIGYPVTNKNGEVIGLKGIFQDVTEQKLIREKNKRNQEMQLLLANNTSDIICLHESDSTFRYITPSIKNILGYEKTDFLGKKAFQLIHEEDANLLKIRMKEKKTREPFPFRALHKSGHYVWLESLATPVYRKGQINYFVSSTRDITEWVLAKERIQEYQSSLQRLTNEITLIEEKQKRQIASNIHDNLSQALVISKMKINYLQKKQELNGIEDDLDFIESHITDALENSRKITFELSPPILYQLGIIEAVNWLLENLEEKHKIKFKLKTDLLSVNLNETKSIILYRSVQEVLANAIKYAKATIINVNINKTEKEVIIHVIDNGIGFDTKELGNFGNKTATGSGFGLFTVKERVNNLKGKFIIDSEINAGTKISISIPFNNE